MFLRYKLCRRPLQFPHRFRRASTSNTSKNATEHSASKHQRHYASSNMADQTHSHNPDTPHVPMALLSPAKSFLESLPIVRSEDLPEDSHTCHICQELFDDPDPAVEEEAENPVRLPCNHIMGSVCLAKWFSRNKSCPMVSGPAAISHQTDGKSLKQS